MYFRLDPNPDDKAHTLVQIFGTESGHTKKTLTLGPPDSEEHIFFEENLEIDENWDHPHEDHLINVFSVYEDTDMTQTHCTTPCYGNTTEKSFFPEGKSSFKQGEYIQLVIMIHPNDNLHTLLNAEIVGVESGEVKATATFGPAGNNTAEYFVSTIEVGFDNPEEEHIINVFSTDDTEVVEFELSAYTNNNTVLSFTLHATTMTALAKYSELIAALIMVMVYLFILLETIHRTLVAIFGSMVALFFFFLIHMVRSCDSCLGIICLGVFTSSFDCRL